MTGHRSKSIGATLLTVLVAFLPSLSCPACWPAYAGLLSSVGLGFFNYTPYLPYLTTVLVAISVLAIYSGERKCSSYLLTVTGFLGGTAIVSFQTIYKEDWLLYIGASLLILASVVNTLKMRKKAVLCSNKSCSERVEG